MTEVVYLNGWYDEEHDGFHAFRWMSREAHCSLDVPRDAAFWLRVAASHDFPGPGPVLSVSANGELVGQRRAEPGSFSYLFPMSTGGAIDLSLVVDRTFRAPHDSRDLGLAIRGIEVIDFDSLDAPLDGEGWYDWEHHEYFPFRWMGPEARVVVPARLCGGASRFAAVPICGDFEDGSQALSITASGSTVVDLPLLPDWHVYGFELPSPRGREPLDLTFHVNRLLPAETHATDPRALGIRVGRLEFHGDGRRHDNLRQLFGQAWRALETARRSRIGPQGDRPRLPGDGAGWFPWESQLGTPFRWMGLEARATISGAVRAGARFCSIPARSDYDDLSQVLTVELNGRVAAEIPLVPSWSHYSLRLPEAHDADVDMVFRASKAARAKQGAGDHRQLAVRVGAFSLHSDEARHECAVAFSENALRNRREYERGATVLSSFPLSVGIDLYGKCNIKPPCVYCLWDQAKELESGKTNAVVDDRTLAEYGDFFYSAGSLVNCSFGEPLLHPRLAPVLDLLARFDKEADIATNGQAFTPATVQTLAGRNLALYVSLDAASAETYARLRNDRWHDVLTGLTFLREARRLADWLPRVNMVFMPMKANLHDLEPYFKLCRMLRASSLVLRPLTYPEAPGIQADRGGYHFDYAREMLEQAELPAIFAQCNEYSHRYGVPVANQFDFGLKEPLESGAETH